MTKHILIISYVEFDTHSPRQARYKEITVDHLGAVTRERHLSRTPKAARFDEVYRNDSGWNNISNAHKRERIYDHPLLKPGAYRPKTGAPYGNKNRMKGPKPYDKRISFRCYSEDYAQWEEKAGQAGVSVNEFAIDALNEAATRTC